MSGRTHSKRSFHRVTVAEDGCLTIKTDRGEFITSPTLRVEQSDTGNITYAMLDLLIHTGHDDEELVHAPRAFHSDGQFYWLTGCVVTEMHLLPASDKRVRSLMPRHWQVS